jgi:GTPase SAR1 family protein
LTQQFRILIIGDSKAGKSTLLKKWCGSDDDPLVKNQKGDLVASFTRQSLRGPTQLVLGAAIAEIVVGRQSLSLSNAGALLLRGVVIERATWGLLLWSIVAS